MAQNLKHLNSILTGNAGRMRAVSGDAWNRNSSSFGLFWKHDYKFCIYREPCLRFEMLRPLFCSDVAPGFLKTQTVELEWYTHKRCCSAMPNLLILRSHGLKWIWKFKIKSELIRNLFWRIHNKRLWYSKHIKKTKPRQFGNALISSTRSLLLIRDPKWRSQTFNAFL